MERILMMSGYNNVQLKGLGIFTYLIEHFDMTPEQALTEMKEHGQDTKDAERAIKLINKQKGK